MDDLEIHGTIEQLVAEEHELWEREAAGNATDADRRRLQQLKVSLEYLRPRYQGTEPAFTWRTWNAAASLLSRN